MLPALNDIAARQASPTANTMSQIKYLLDYAATHPNVIL
jgi:hypothetical protein